ncbi:Gfo/Idh/MocA family oxidoreductase [Microbacterium esteraromaticum]|uniref:Gfo/Idh/MocA family oxidoreductase n=1 Tax=Microbacterium esteraromaticum TaxID=57043 RepID=A0A7D8AID8_9MICO|nr:Gfo/Idh/MocA family oxidoreductase [Microbacterium esteraromaticum]QMU96446.1 Gfo/Idh/MocA family oxidoreductase [Microbacterium esteraromaticum]
MARIPLAIIGSGGMGTRHMFGLAELEKAGLNPFDLVAVCDIDQTRADLLADAARDALGRRPAVCADIEGVLRAGAQAVDITTVPRFHHTVAADAIGLGLDVMVEKPVGLTIAAAHALQDALRGSDRILSVAENFRRDPTNRLVKSLIEEGVLGEPRYFHQSSSGGRDLMAISVWRHLKDESGILFDAGTHYTDMMEYYLGPVASVYAQMRLFEQVRYNPAATGGAPASDPGGVYGQFQAAMPAEFTATADDALFALVNFESGAVGQYTENRAGHGRSEWARTVHGSAGAVDIPKDRSGEPLVVTLEGSRTFTGAEILPLVPGFQLDDATAALFGGERATAYGLDFETVDRLLLAVEYAEFGACIASRSRPEVGFDEGMRAIAVCYAMMESGAAGGAIVKVDDVLGGAVREYQRSIDIAIGTSA